jgi:chromosome segregation ATPase
MEMSFAQALNEAKGVILQLSNRVKADAEKIKSQQEQIAAKSAAVAEMEARVTEMAAAHAADLAQASARNADEVAKMEGRIKEAEAAGAHAEAILNRQGERILSLENAAAERDAEIAALRSEIARLSAERDQAIAQLPSNEDAAALAAMTQLLTKAAPAIEKAKKSAAAATSTGVPTMRIAEAA